MWETSAYRQMNSFHRIRHETSRDEWNKQTECSMFVNALYPRSTYVGILWILHDLSYVHSYIRFRFDCILRKMWWIPFHVRITNYSKCSARLFIWFWSWRGLCVHTLVSRAHTVHAQGTPVTSDMRPIIQFMNSWSMLLGLAWFGCGWLTNWLAIRIADG